MHGMHILDTVYNMYYAAVIITGLWKSCTWGTQTSTWLLFAFASGRSENRAVLRVSEESTPHPSRMPLEAQRAGGQEMSVFAAFCASNDIDISRRQQFEYNVQAGYCIQNSIQTNLLQAHHNREHMYNIY